MERARHAADPEKRSAIRRKRNTGFTPELVNRLREEQQGVCGMPGCEAVLDTKNKRSTWGEQADHDHNTGKCRSLLCRCCNHSLGIYEKHQRNKGLRLEPYEMYLAKHGSV